MKGIYFSNGLYGRSQTRTIVYIFSIYCKNSLLSKFNFHSQMVQPLLCIMHKTPSHIDRLYVKINFYSMSLYWLLKSNACKVSELKKVHMFRVTSTNGTIPEYSTIR